MDTIRSYIEQFCNGSIYHERKEEITQSERHTEKTYDNGPTGQTRNDTVFSIIEKRICVSVAVYSHYMCPEKASKTIPLSISNV